MKPGLRPRSCEEFNRQISDFVAQVQATASKGKRLLSRAEAFAVGVQLLDDASGLPDYRGYEFALLNVVQDGCQEMDAVFLTILEGLKQRERTCYLRWICARFVETHDWQMKCLLVETIIQVHRENTGVELFTGDPARFAADLPDLLGAYLESAPIDCTNANNIVRSSSGPLVDIQTTPTNFLWEGNFFSDATLGITSPGIVTNNPLLVLSSDGFWRPATNSPVQGAAAGDYSALTNDFDGQPRPSAKDAGCDQSSTSQIVRRPLDPTDVGPIWMRSVGAIRTAAFVSNSVTLTWDSLPALTYQVQFSSNLLNWATVSQTISNLQTSATWTDDGSQTGGVPATQAARFYRIRLAP